MTYEEIYEITREVAAQVLRDEDERGGPMQREYPRAVVDSMAESIASRVAERGDPMNLRKEGPSRADLVIGLVVIAAILYGAVWFGAGIWGGP